jgi:hypothetical protein
MSMRSTVVALIVTSALLVSACSASDSTSVKSDARGLAHIHGLGVNPADGALYAGTHYGVYRFADERAPELVGGVVQDFMGFTVAGPNHFLGSGHPGESDHNDPPNLGLIESTNSGQSWNSLSLKGATDFHSLEYRHGIVYGLDSGTRTVMVSADKKTWDRRSAIKAIDIAVSPQDANEILATTADGLLRSRDQARTFSPVSAVPPLVSLSWPQDGPLIGVDAAATVYSSDDDGATWQGQQALGQRPQALQAAGGGQVFVATDAAIHRSTNNGATFEVFHAFTSR